MLQSVSVTIWVPQLREAIECGLKQDPPRPHRALSYLAVAVSSLHAIHWCSGISEFVLKALQQQQGKKYFQWAYACCTGAPISTQTSLKIHK